MPATESPAAIELIEQTVPRKSMLTRTELSECSGLLVQSLANLAANGGGPPFVRLGRAVRYPRAGVVRWLTENAVLPVGV